MNSGETASEELANSISHGVGAVLSVFALVGMVVCAAPASVWHLVSVTIFGLCLVALYLSSTIYHTVTSSSWKPIWRVIDHCCIFLLIAGSYMPWLLVNLRGPTGWALFGIIWGLAIAGIILKAFFLEKFHILGVGIYIAMGWLICIAGDLLIKNVNTTGLIWLTAGGLAYTGGVVFFLQKKLKYAHAVWHGFVLLGSACHVIAVLVGVIPHR